MKKGRPAKQIRGRDFLGFLGVTLAIFLGTSAFGAYNLNKRAYANVPNTPNFKESRLDLKLDPVSEDIGNIEQVARLETLETSQPSLDNRIYLRGYTEADKEIAIEALFAEARNCDRDYMEKVARTFVTRAVERGKSVSEVITADGQYSYLNRGDINKVKRGNAHLVAGKSKLERKAYETCEKVIDDVFQNGVAENELVDHYFVRDKQVPLSPGYCPEWAFEKVNGKMVARGPKYVIEHSGKTTRFYYLTPAEVRARGGVFSRRV